jgi:hypothetical protein
MADEQEDPPGADGAPDDEPAVDHSSAHEREEVDEDIPTTDPVEVRNPAERTIRFGFTGLRAIPVVRPGVSGVMRRFQEERAAALRSSVLGAAWRPVVRPGLFGVVCKQQEDWAAMRSSVLRDAWRPVIPPDLLRVVHKRQEDWATVMRSRALASNVLRVAWRPVVPPDLFRVVGKHQEIWAKTLRRFAAGFEEQLRAGAPPNWQFGEDWPKLTMISETVQQDGIPLAWVPRGDIVVGLVHAEGIEGRRAILADREADIVQDCFTCLDDVHAPELAELVTNAREAVRVFQDQHAKPAQALATVVLDAVLRLLFAAPNFSYGGIRRQLAEVWDNAPLRYMRSALVLAAIPGALEQFWPDRGDPVPVRFNRHASAHTVHAEQFTRTNALVAIMIITSLLRETHESAWYVAPDAEQPAS